MNNIKNKVSACS